MMKQFKYTILGVSKILVPRDQTYFCGKIYLVSKNQNLAYLPKWYTLIVY